MPAPDLIVRQPSGQTRRILSCTRSEMDCKRMSATKRSSSSLTNLVNLSHVNNATYSQISIHQSVARLRLLGKPILGTFASSTRFPKRLVKTPSGTSSERLASKDARLAMTSAIELDTAAWTLLTGKVSDLNSLMLLRETLETVARRVRAPMDEEAETPIDGPSESPAQLKIRVDFSRRFLACGGVTALLRLIFAFRPVTSMPKLSLSPIMKEIQSKHKDSWDKMISTCMMIVQDICFVLPDFGSTLGESSEFLASITRHMRYNPTFDASLRLLEDSVMSRASRPLDLATEYPPLRTVAMSLSPHDLAYFSRFIAQLALEENEYHLLASGLDLLAYKRGAILAEEMGVNVTLRNHIYVLNVFPEIISRLVCIISDRRLPELNNMFWPSFARLHGLITRRPLESTFMSAMGVTSASNTRITPEIAWRSAPNVQPLHLIRRPVRTHFIPGLNSDSSDKIRLEQERHVAPANIVTEEEEEEEETMLHVSAAVAAASASSSPPPSSSSGYGETIASYARNRAAEMTSRSSSTENVSVLRRAMETVLNRVASSFQSPSPPLMEETSNQSETHRSTARGTVSERSQWSEGEDDVELDVSEDEGDVPMREEDLLQELQAAFTRQTLEQTNDPSTQNEQSDDDSSNDDDDEDNQDDDRDAMPQPEFTGDARQQHRRMLRLWASNAWMNAGQRDIWLQSPRQEAMHSLRTLCSGPFRRSVQDALGKSGLIEALIERFDRAIWDPNAQHTQVFHGPDCRCDLWSLLRTAIVRLIHEFCNRPSDNWHNKRLLFTQAELESCNSTLGILPNSRIQLAFTRPPNVPAGDYDPDPGLPGGAATVRGRGLAWRLAAMLECDRVAQEEARMTRSTEPNENLSPAEAQRRLEAKGEVRYLVSAALEGLVRGVQPKISNLLSSWGVLSNIAHGILLQHAHVSTSNVVPSTNPNNGTMDQGLFQVQFDLLGELLKDSPAVLSWICGGKLSNEVVEAFGPGFTSNQFQSLMSIACAQLVDSNVFLRSLALTVHHYKDSNEYDIAPAIDWLKNGGVLRALRCLWSVIALENVSQDNVCCINTSIVLLTIARIDGENENDLNDGCTSLGRIVQQVKEWDDSSEGRRTDDTAFRLQFNTPISKRPVSGKLKEFYQEKPEKNFRALLFFWRGYYNLRVGERYSMEFSTSFTYDELSKTVELLCDATGAVQLGALLNKNETVFVPYTGVNLRDLSRHLSFMETRKRFKEDGNDHGRNEIEGWGTRGRAWGRN